MRKKIEGKSFVTNYKEVVFDNSLLCDRTSPYDFTAMLAPTRRLRELHVRNNRLGILLELAVYMRQMRRLAVLDMRANPICAVPGYQDVVFDTFPMLLSLNATELDPVSQVMNNMTKPH